MPSAPATPRRVGFRERMAGRLAAPVVPDGDSRMTDVVLEAEVSIDDLDEFLVNPNHRARLVGHVTIGGQGVFPAEGKVELFVVGDRPGQRLMRYQAGFTTGRGAHTLAGTKYVQPRSGVYVWRDVTTLYTAIWRLDPHPQVVAAGVLKLSLWQGIRLLASLRGHATGALSALGAVLRFIRFFLAEVILQFFGWPR